MTSQVIDHEERREEEEGSSVDRASRRGHNLRDENDKN